MLLLGADVGTFDGCAVPVGVIDSSILLKGKFIY
jgi:hypothetical protein